MIADLRARNDVIFSRLVDIRRTLHKNPELAFEEYETAALVKATLEPLDLHIEAGIAKTGVVATLVGDQPGPTRLLRADMDALPILEANTFDFASQVPGKMHACGHDAHTASLLGTAMILSEMRADLKGSVRFLFQPSEEKIPGGAKPMIEDGVLDDNAVSTAPSAVFGQHVAPEIPYGKIGVRDGMYMASADEIYIDIRGAGGHGAKPHLIGTDTVLAASHVIVALQSVISRNAPPNVPTVLTFGKMLADGATNVLPEHVRIEGTFRSMDEEWRFKAHDLIQRVAQHTAQAYGSAAEVEVAVGYPALCNDHQATAHVRQAAKAYVGEENVIELDLTFVSEDFAWYLKHTPGSFYRIGSGNVAEGITHGLHTPRFTIDENALRTAPGFMAYMALTYTG
ncbi:MAG: M20 family metallopeptidase [Rhodothermales bacterium]